MAEEKTIILIYNLFGRSNFNTNVVIHLFELMDTSTAISTATSFALTVVLNYIQKNFPFSSPSNSNSNFGH